MHAVRRCTPGCIGGVRRGKITWRRRRSAAADKPASFIFRRLQEKKRKRDNAPPPHPGPPPSPNPPVRSPNPPAPSPNHQQTHMQDGFPISMTYCEKSILFNFNIYHVTQQMKFYILGDSMCRGLGIFNYNFRSHSLSFINDFMT